jgi:hypothetical protein
MWIDHWHVSYSWKLKEGSAGSISASKCLLSTIETLILQAFDGKTLHTMPFSIPIEFSL